MRCFNGLNQRKKFWKFRSVDCWKLHFRHSFWLQKHSLYIICLQQQQFSLKFQSFMGSFMRMSFITQFKIEFLLPFTGCRKVLGKMPDMVRVWNYVYLREYQMQGFIQACLLTSVFHERLSSMAIGHNPTYISMLALATGGSYEAV